LPALRIEIGPTVLTTGDPGRLQGRRAPLLFIGGSEDQIIPPSLNKSNVRRYKKSPAVTEYYERE